MHNALIDIGNSTIVIAIADANGEIKNSWRFKTQKDATTTYFRHEIQAGFNGLKINPSDIASVTISSVVPEVNYDISRAMAEITGCVPHFFNVADAQQIINIDIESPSLAGNDRLADAIGAACCYGYPAIVFDMGTATTVGIINEEKTFLGGMIMPGVKTSLTALCERASQLPTINIEAPENIVGRNTLECMQSGVIHGNAAMIDGIIDRLSPMFNTPVTLVATGGMASKIIPHCKHKIIFDQWLQFKGIFNATIKPQQ